jgi:hypothetical protein
MLGQVVSLVIKHFLQVESSVWCVTLAEVGYEGDVSMYVGVVIFFLQI